jgi:hypothetical protein
MALNGRLNHRDDVNNVVLAHDRVMLSRSGIVGAGERSQQYVIYEDSKPIAFFIVNSGERFVQN